LVEGWFFRLGVSAEACGWFRHLRGIYNAGVREAGPRRFGFHLNPGDLNTREISGELRFTDLYCGSSNVFPMFVAEDLKRWAKQCKRNTTHVRGSGKVKGIVVLPFI